VAVPAMGSGLDKRMSEEDVVAALSDGMTIGVGGWGSRRKPMSLIRAICRSDLKDLTVVSYGGPDVGLLCAMGKVKKVVYGFVSLDSIPLEPYFRRARQSGAVEAVSLDEGMFQLGLRAAAWRLPFLPTRAGLGSDVTRVNPWLQTVESPYPVGFDPLKQDSTASAGSTDAGEREVLVAMPALRLDAALLHVHRADAAGNGAIGGSDPYFDDLFAAAADRAYLSCEAVVPTAGLKPDSPESTDGLRSLIIPRMAVAGVVEAPRGAHFTACDPDYGRDEGFQRDYAATAKDPAAWEDFRARYIDLADEAAYRDAVAGRSP